MPVLSGATYATRLTALMRLYNDKKINSAVRARTKFHKHRKRNPQQHPVGEKYGIAMEFGLGEGAAANVDEMDDHPPADPGVDKWGYMQMAEHRGTIRVSRRRIKEGGDMRPSLAIQIRKMVTMMARNCEWRWFLSKRNELSIVSDVTGIRTVVAAAGKFIRVGQNIDIVLLATGLLGAGAAGVVNAKITAITARDPATGTCTFTVDTDIAGFAGIGNTYGIFITNTWNKGHWGLSDMISATDPPTANYLELDRDTDVQMKSYTDTLGTATLTGMALANFCTAVLLNPDGSGESLDEAWVHPYVFNDLIAEQENRKRTPLGRHDFPIWGNQLSLRVAENDKPIAVMGAEYIDPSIAYTFPSDVMEIHHPPGTQPDGEWIKDGSDTIQLLEMKAVYQSVYSVLNQYICTRPWACGLLTGIDWSPVGTWTA